MPIEMPPLKTGDLKRDFDALWDWAFRLWEALQLMEEERNGLPKT